MARQWACKCGHVNDPQEQGFSSHKCAMCNRDQWVPYYFVGGGLALLALLIGLIVFMVGQPTAAYKEAFRRASSDGVVTQAEQDDLQKLAKRYRLTNAKITSLEDEVRAALGVKREPAPEAPMGSCNLKPTAVQDVARLLQFLKQGMTYASQKQYESALAEFQQVLAIDPNFLGIHQNIGSAYMALKRYPDAESAIQRELKLIACLNPLSDAQLAAFAYMIETPVKEQSGRQAAQTAAYRSRLGTLEAGAHYNLACLYSLQRREDVAILELQTAVKLGFSDGRSLQTDPDLANIRKTPDFQALVASLR